MKIYELVVIGSVLVICAASIGWLLVDMNRQLKAYKERCESLENDED